MKTKRLTAQEMDGRLDEFLKQHQCYFSGSEGEIHGKLEAFNKEWLHGHIEKMCRGCKMTDEWQKRGLYDD